MNRKKRFTKKVGIWLDQEKAYVITLSDRNEPLLEKIDSGVELTVRYAGEKKPYSHFGTTYSNEQGRKQRRQKQEREQYFKKLIDAVRDADSIYLFGPGKAKQELENAINRDHVIRGKLVGMETEGRLTKNQMLRRVEKFYRDIETPEIRQ